MEPEKLIKIKELIEGFIRSSGIDGRVASVEEVEGGLLARVESQEAGYLIGRDGDNLKAMQLIIRAMVNKVVGEAPRLTVDVNNYQQERLELLKSDARNLARLVAENKITRALPPMNAFERRVIHSALADINGIKTESEGLGEERRIVIKPIN